MPRSDLSFKANNGVVRIVHTVDDAGYHHLTATAPGRRPYTLHLPALCDCPNAWCRNDHVRWDPYHRWWQLSKKDREACERKDKCHRCHERDLPALIAQIARTYTTQGRKHTPAMPSRGGWGRLDDKTVADMLGWTVEDYRAELAVAHAG